MRRHQGADGGVRLSQRLRESLLGKRGAGEAPGLGLNRGRMFVQELGGEASLSFHFLICKTGLRRRRRRGIKQLLTFMEHLF